MSLLAEVEMCASRRWNQESFVRSRKDRFVTEVDQA